MKAIKQDRLPIILGGIDTRPLAAMHPMIPLWGQVMGSYAYYIHGELEKADKDGAPWDAIYERDGEWFTARSIQNTELKDRLFNAYGKQLQEAQL